VGSNWDEALHWKERYEVVSALFESQRRKAERASQVFDAAMALAAVARRSALESTTQIDAYYRLLEACRKAEEVERG
jgi:hypothetical protein